MTPYGYSDLMTNQSLTVRRTAAKRISIWIVAAVVASLAAQATGPSAGAVVEWEFVEESVSLGMSGVSPHVEKVAGGDRVWRSDGPVGTAVSLCTDAGSCASETLSTPGGGPINDFSVAQTASVCGRTSNESSHRPERKPSTPRRASRPTASASVRRR